MFTKSGIFTVGHDNLFRIFDLFKALFRPKLCLVYFPDKINDIVVEESRAAGFFNMLALFRIVSLNQGSDKVDDAFLELVESAHGVTIRFFEEADQNLEVLDVQFLVASARTIEVLGQRLQSDNIIPAEVRPIIPCVFHFVWVEEGVDVEALEENIKVGFLLFWILMEFLVDKIAYILLERVVVVFSKPLDSVTYRDVVGHVH